VTIESLCLEPDRHPLADENPEFTYELRELHFGLARAPRTGRPTQSSRKSWLSSLFGTSQRKRLDPETLSLVRFRRDTCHELWGLGACLLLWIDGRFSTLDPDPGGRHTECACYIGSTPGDARLVCYRRCRCAAFCTASTVKPPAMFPCRSMYNQSFSSATGTHTFEPSLSAPRSTGSFPSVP